MPSGGQRLRTVEYPDVVETQKPDLKYVHAIRVLAIYPPCEIQQEFMKYAFEEAPVGAPADAFLDLVDTPRRPGMHRRVAVAARPLIDGQEPVRGAIPLPHQGRAFCLADNKVQKNQREHVRTHGPPTVPT